jgi:hypothetical protein
MLVALPMTGPIVLEAASAPAAATSATPEMSTILKSIFVPPIRFRDIPRLLRAESEGGLPRFHRTLRGNREAP